MGSKCIILLGLAIFQCWLPQNDAAYVGNLPTLGGHRIVEVEDSSPEELLDELRSLVYKLVEDAIDKLEAIKKNSTGSIAEVQNNTEALLDKEHDQLLQKLDDIRAKAEAKGIDPTECIKDGKRQLQVYLDAENRSKNYCVAYFSNTIRGYLKEGIQNLQQRKDYEPLLRKELEKCGDNSKCRDKIAKEISQIIASQPGGVKSSVEYTAKLIGLGSLNDCLSKTVNKYIKEGEDSLKTAQKCVDKEKTTIEALKAATPEELLEELHQLVSKSSEEGKGKLDAAKEKSIKGAPDVQAKAKGLLDEEHSKMLKKLDEIKPTAKEDTTDPDECIAQAKEELQIYLESEYLQANYCSYYFLDAVNRDYQEAVIELKSLEDLEPELRKELKACGSEDDCKDKVAKKISAEIEAVPSKIVHYVDDTLKLISLDQLEKCISEKVSNYHEEAEFTIKKAQECINKK